LFPIPGRHEAPSGGWDTLCQDLKGIVLSKLSLRELSAAGPACPEFNEALRSRAAEEQAKLVAVGKDKYGHSLFSVFVTGLRHTLRGVRPWPRMVRKYLAVEKRFAITTTGDFCSAQREDVREGGPSLTSFANVYQCSDVRDLLYGTLYYGKPGGHVREWACTAFDMQTLGKHNLRLCIWVWKKAVVAALGVLRAMCEESPRALRGCREKPLTTVFKLYGLPPGVEGVREAEDLFAPLRPLAEAIAIGWGSEPPDAPREVQTRPLGVVIVRLF
jgi:hypothetical protein